MRKSNCLFYIKFIQKAKQQEVITVHVLFSKQEVCNFRSRIVCATRKEQRLRILRTYCFALVRIGWKSCSFTEQNERNNEKNMKWHLDEFNFNGIFSCVTNIYGGKSVIARFQNSWLVCAVIKVRNPYIIL